MLSYVAVLVAVLVFLSLVFWTALTGVPSLSSSRSETNAMVELLKDAKLPEHAVIFDLGSGWGAMVVALARAFPQASVHGVEMSLFPYLVSRLRTRRLSNVSLRWGNFFRSDLANADAITCYLMPGLMARLSEFLDRMVKPGTRVVSNTFLFRERHPLQVRQAAWCGTVALYVWPGRQWVG
jgi:cyclopropane fatty-acyl-phospholipid synthase-like methyltransferase